MSKSKKPTGLSIARKDTAFTASWKCGDKNYSQGQQLNYKLNSGKWTKKSITKTARKVKFFTLNENSYYPHGKKLTSISVRVRGNAGKYEKKGKKVNPKWSKWTSETMKFSVPNKPKTLTTTLNSANQTTFAWTTTTSDTDKKPFHDVQYQSILVKECGQTNGAKLSWKSSKLGWLTGSKNANDSLTVTEDSALLAANSYTRWIRVRSRGAAGPSDWKYAKHVYANAYTATINSVKASVSSGVTTLTVKWTAQASKAHPIDSTKVQYGIATPDDGLTVPDGISATDIVTSEDTNGTDAYHGQVSAVPSTDQCMWVRVVTVHDSNSTYSAWKLASVGALNTPSGLSATFSTQAVISATNNSTVPDSCLAVVYKSDVTDPVVIGIIPHGSTSVTVPYPSDGSTQQIVGVYAFQGDYTQTVRADGVYAYSISANMTSDTVWLSNTLPAAPSDVTAEISDTAGEVILTWDWAWSDADAAELSWSQNPNSWESTDEPETYELDNSHAARWRISELETGVTWYFKVRLGIKTDDTYTYGPYSSIVAVDLSSAPIVPTLTLSEAVVPESGSFDASWVYITSDGTTQAYAEVCLATISGDTITYGDILQRVETAQKMSFTVSDLSWSTGTTYSLCVRVTSGSGKTSEWSDPVSIAVADPITCTISSTSLTTVTITDAEENTRTVTALTVMPLTATVTGADVTGTTRLTIERDDDYTMERPDESKIFSYEGELIAVHTQTGEDAITIEIEDLIGLLDDEAKYKLVATVEDDLGQSASAEIPFEVHWAHQAIMPEGRAVTDDFNLITQITPIAPTGWTAGDTCDIYRLSVDRPVLIVQDGTFGSVYVDPYPAFGETGGHRIVYKTINGDYITEDNLLAWIDLQADENDYLPVEKCVIDFDGDRVEFEYNITTSHSWEKDFKETTYLGGSVQGDWNPAVKRSAKITAVLVMPQDLEMIEAMRRLATYSGICNVRTPDGSSFAADVQVSEDRGYSTAGKICTFNLSVKRVDPEELDGQLLSDWVVS